MGKQIDLKALLESKMGNIEPMEGSKIAIERAEMSVPHNLMFDAESTEFKPETKPVTASGARGLTVEEAKSFDDEMNRFIDTVLIAGVDYGIIPSCKKPTLLKSGAEKILNYLGLIARTEISNRVEDYNIGFFSYEAKVYLIDYNGVVKGEGIGITNTREGKYAKTNGYAVQNTVLKMAKKRALVDAALNVGNLSARFTQDVEDMNIEPDNVGGKSPEELKQGEKPKADRPVTQKQLKYLETLMGQHNTSAEAMNKYCKTNFGVDDYKKITGVQASTLIEKFKAVE
ncbi:MAG: hypothetical protein IJE43_06020 [Alphaproteobacteria bacterium]|nr:hypothetical protein [Alphaproteobacteria bacterium]MBQ6886801.1 hypothetical protein [Lachnospiraceae bacterium]